MQESEKEVMKTEMSFLDHLDALRWHLVRSCIAIMVFSIVAFIFKEIIFDDIILAPRNADFITNRIFCRLAELINADNLCIKEIALEIININLSGQFTTHIYISLFAGFVVASPYVIWELWSFVKPALHNNEKSSSRGAVLYTALLFILGILFGYYIVVPLTVNFFGNYSVSEGVTNNIALGSFVSTVISVVIGLGVVFEMPMLVFFLSKVGLVTPSFMRKKRKIMVVVIFVIAAIITPADILSMFLVAIPLQVLYEFSILISRRVEKKQLKASTT